VYIVAALVVHVVVRAVAARTLRTAQLILCSVRALRTLSPPLSCSLEDLCVCMFAAATAARS
jgi:hypothetical protein